MAVTLHRSVVIWGVVALLWGGAAILFATTRPVGPKNLPQSAVNNSQPSVSPTPNRAVSAAQLAAANGKGGQPCWMSIKNVVYNVPDSSVWGGGEHMPSNGLVYCGAVGDDLIGRSPHGDTVLASLEVIGQLQ